MWVLIPGTEPGIYLWNCTAYELFMRMDNTAKPMRTHTVQAQYKHSTSVDVVSYFPITVPLIILSC